MTFIFECFLALFLCTFIFIPSVFFSIELLVGIFYKQTKEYSNQTNSFEDIYIIIPAHDEEFVIEYTLSDIKNELGSLDNVIVVADNCSDKTADIARSFGSLVIVRDDKIKRGKGYALDAGVCYLKKLIIHPEIIIVFDADCQFVPGSFRNLVNSCRVNQSVIQSEYLMKAPLTANVKVKLAEFAWLVKNKIRPQGLSFFNINCQLQGSGMAFPWSVIERFSFASGSIVEDLELGIKLSAMTERVNFEPSSKVISYFPETEAGTNSQRKRWEHGHLSSIMLLPKPMFTLLLRGDIRSFLTFFDAMIPPTVLFLIFLFVILIISVFLTFFNIFTPFYISLASFFGVNFSLFFCWLIYGREILQVKDFKSIFWYVLNKFNIYSSFLKNPEKQWVRTDRGKKDEE